MKKNSVLFLTFCLLNTYLSATHIVGGDITYTRLGISNDYEIKLDIMRDCAGASYDTETEIFILDAANNQVVQTRKVSPSNFTTTYPDINPSACMSTNICYERKVMTFNATLPPNTAGYQIAYARCCRNATISNIEQPLEGGFTLLAFVPSSSFVNSSPVFDIDIPKAVILGTSFTVSFHATDIDGDSLVYALAEPLMGGDTNDPIPTNFSPAPPVIWLPGYSAQNPLGANANTQLNTQTGEMTGFANQIGQYVFAISVSQYRNGIFLGATRREMQLNVVNSQYFDYPPTFTLQPTTPFSNDTLYFYAGIPNTANFIMADLQGNSAPEPLIVGNLYGDIFNNSLFNDIATTDNPPSGMSPIQGTISMIPYYLDAGKVGKVYVSIWHTDNCATTNTYSLLDSFYVKILPCPNRALSPIITDLTPLSSTEIQVEWQTFSQVANFDHYVLERKSPSTAWQNIATFPDNVQWAYIDNSALLNDGTSFCYRIGAVSSCIDNSNVNYSSDSCTIAFDDLNKSDVFTKLSCYPNPNSTGNLGIELENFEYSPLIIRITDRLGRLVWEKRYEAQDTRNISLSLDGLFLEKNLYYVSAISPETKQRVASAVLVIE